MPGRCGCQCRASGMHSGCQCASHQSRPPKHISCRSPSRMTLRQKKHNVPLVAGVNSCSLTTSVLVVLHCGQPLLALAVRRQCSSQRLCACTGQTKHTHLSCSAMGSEQKRHSPPLERDLGGVRLLNLFPRNIVEEGWVCCGLGLQGLELQKCL